MILDQEPRTRNHEDRRAASLARIAREFTVREIAETIARADAGDPDTRSGLALDYIDVADLRILLAGRVVDASRLAELRARERIVLLAATVEQGHEVARRCRFDPAKTLVRTDARRARRDFERIRDAGIRVELLIAGEGAFQ